MEHLWLGLFEEILYVLLSIAVLYVINYIKKNLDEKKIALLKSIVEDGVLFAQQIGKNLDGEKKYQRALEYITDVLEVKNIKVTPKQLEGLIESVLKRLKMEYGDSWYEL